MRKDEFVLRGRTNSKDGSASPPVSGEEILNFSGFKPGYAYRLVEFNLYPMTPQTGGKTMVATIVAGKTGMDPEIINYNDPSLIAVAVESFNCTHNDGDIQKTVINDTYLITQNLILTVKDSASGEPINWQCKFKGVKMTKAEEAVTNYKQFVISDNS